MYRLVNGCSVWNSQIAEIRSIEDLEDRIKNGSLPRRDVYLPHIPYKIRKIINRCLEINVKKRYDNVLDIINDLSGVDCEVDWQYEKTSSSEKWSCYRPEDIEISIVLTPKGQLYELYTIINDLKCSKIFKVDEMCKDNITKKDAYYKIENYINN